MKTRHIFITCLAMLLTLSAWAETEQKGEKQDIVPGVAIRDIPLSNGPSAFVIGPHHEFNSVMEGVEVLHDFAIKNNGDAMLIVERVLTD